MIKQLLPTLLATLVLAGGAAVSAQTAADPQTAKHDTVHKADVTYGRVKEWTAGQKIVIDVANAPDKSYDLTDTNMHVTVAKALKVGDPVKITEREVSGKKTVQIVRDTTSGVKHGAKTKTEEQKEEKK